MQLAAVDAAAAKAGLYPGQNVSDALALCASVDMREIDRSFLETVFADFADWHSNASPLVAVLVHDAPYGDLMLDITGVSHLFGGEDAMLNTLIARLEALGFSVCGAIAETVGAAWALSHFAPGRIIGDDLETELAELPIAALRITPSQGAGLMQMGLKTIGQLYGRDRKALQARFGASLLTRLDQALGEVEERIVPRIPVAERYVERGFVEPIGLLDDVLMCTSELAQQLAARLEKEGLGGQAFHLFIYRVDHKMMSLSVNAARATRDPAHIARLFINRSERLSGEYDAGFGIDMIRLAASSVTPLASVQISTMQTDDGAEDLDRLYDRMSSRLGPQALVWSKFVNTYTPERAVRLEPVMARTGDGAGAFLPALAPRPLRLLLVPELIAVTAEVPDSPPAGMVWRKVSYRFAKASGPERIGPEWWTLPNPTVQDEGAIVSPYEEARLTRDYFVGEDGEGRRFWLFREGLYRHGTAPRWFMHGLFA